LGVGKSTIVGVAALVKDDEVEDKAEDTTGDDPDDDSRDTGVGVSVS
jgi:hypothetical protein